MLPDSLTFWLPVPPSVNELYANRRGGRGPGRFKTKRYRQWIEAADNEVFAQRLRGPFFTAHNGKLAIEIRLPCIRGDASNRIKAAEDYLVSRAITGDDRHNYKISIEIDEALAPSSCQITITPIRG